MIQVLLEIQKLLKDNTPKAEGEKMELLMRHCQNFSKSGELGCRSRFLLFPIGGLLNKISIPFALLCKVKEALWRDDFHDSIPIPLS